jgi:hypothetical protein
MAHDAISSYERDIAAGRDALLICDTNEMCDALNRRIHDTTIEADAPTVAGVGGHLIAVGDLIISRRNDPTVMVYEATQDVLATSAVRNGNRWRVAAIDADRNRIAARGLSDGARAVFDGDYVREYISYGYAVTVHAAQGVTVDTTHAVLGENATRAMLYVAMTRGRDSNGAYLYETVAESSEYGDGQPDGVHAVHRGSSRAAANVMRAIIATSTAAQTAHDVAATTDRAQLPARVASLLIDRRASAVQNRRIAYRNWAAESWERAADHDKSIDQHISRGRDHGLDHGLEF